MIDGCNNEVNYNKYWVFITAIDGWGNYYESNKFNVTIGPSSPSANSNLFGPINVYQNHYVEVELPDYLFVQNNKSIENFESSSWINNTSIKIATRTVFYLKVKIFLKKFECIEMQSI